MTDMRAAMAFVLVVLGGCSLVATSRHPSVARDGKRSCPSYASVAVDGLVAAAGIFLGGAAIISDATSSQRDGFEGMGTVVGGGLLLATAPWTLGTIVGAYRNGACENELAQRGPYAGSASPASYAPRSGAAPE